MLQLISSEEVVARLAARVSPGAALAFDADGTLWSGDIGIDTFERMLEGRAVRAEACEALRREAVAHGVDAQGDATAAARALYAAFERGSYPERDAFQMMSWVFAGYGESEARAFGLDVVDRVGLASRLHPEVLPVLEWASAHAVPVYVVSASCEIVVRAALDSLGIRVADVFAMAPAVEGGVIQPRIAGPVTYGPGKVEALARGSGGRSILGAFGDSAYDFAMLASSAVPVAVRPKPELRARAETCAGFVELAPPAP